MNKIYACLFLTTYVFSAGCVSTKSEIKNNANDRMDLERSKSYCIGRYTVEIPAAANPLNRYDQYDSFMIKVKENATRQDFDEAVQKVRKEYSTGDWSLTDDFQEQEIEGHLTKIIKGKTSKDKGDPFDVFGFVLDKKTLFLIEGGHSDLPEWTEKSNEAIQHLVKNLRYRPEHEIPTENGQCIYQGFIKDNDQKFRHSKQKMGFDFKDYPSVVLRFDSETNSRETAALIPRVESKLSQAGQSQRQINKDNIRKGEKNTTHLNGQEWISVEYKTKNIKWITFIF